MRVRTLREYLQKSLAVLNAASSKWALELQAEDDKMDKLKDEIVKRAVKFIEEKGKLELYKKMQGDIAAALLAEGACETEVIVPEGFGAKPVKKIEAKPKPAAEEKDDAKKVKAKPEQLEKAEEAKKAEVEAKPEELEKAEASKKAEADAKQEELEKADEPKKAEAEAKLEKLEKAEEPKNAEA